RLPDSATIFNALDSMLLHEHPSIAAVLESPHKFIEDVRMIRQRHFRRRKAADTAERFQTEYSGKVMLPRFDVKAKILNGRRRRNRMAPGGPKPFHGSTISGIHGDSLEIVEYIVQ